jgi:phosphomannomutase
MALIRSISGLRGTLGNDLLPHIIAKYCVAFHQFLPKGAVVIGRDGRPSGKWIQDLASITLSAMGRKVKRIGIAPTPTVQVLVEHSNAAGGIAITASHNPEEWNGLKFLNSDGVFLDKEENEILWEIFDNKKFEYDYTKGCGNQKDNINAINFHIDKVLGSSFINAENIKKELKNRKYRVVIDAVNASGSRTIPDLVKQLGCKVVCLHCDESGVFPHEPEPIPANLGSLAQAVKDEQADMGIAVDPDADRLVLIDNEGEPIGEEKTIALAVKALLSKEYVSSKENIIVVNQSTSRMIEDIAAELNAEVVRSDVGEINVVKKMKEVDAIIGGEGSGGVILPECHYGRDSLVGTALILGYIAESGKSLKELSDSLPKYEIIKTKQEFSGELQPIIDKVKSIFSDGTITEGDGIKIDYPDRWVQLRASNTEPVIRIMAEAPTIEEAQALITRTELV